MINSPAKCTCSLDWQGIPGSGLWGDFREIECDTCRQARLDEEAETERDEMREGMEENNR